jgi:hypothetical protein
MYPELNYTMDIEKYPFSLFPMAFMGVFIYSETRPTTKERSGQE